jgi:hypothetical protein
MITHITSIIVIDALICMTQHSAESIRRWRPLTPDTAAL